MPIFLNKKRGIGYFKMDTRKHTVDTERETEKSGKPLSLSLSPGILRWAACLVYKMNVGVPALQLIRYV